MRTQWSSLPKVQWCALGLTSPPLLASCNSWIRMRPSHWVSRILLSKRWIPQRHAVSQSHSQRHAFIARLQKHWLVSHKASTLQDFMTLLNAYFYHLTTTLTQHPAYNWSVKDRAHLPSCSPATLSTFSQGVLIFKGIFSHCRVIKSSLTASRMVTLT